MDSIDLDLLVERAHTEVIGYMAVDPGAPRRISAELAHALGIERCVGCSALLGGQSCDRDIEGEPLCFSCWTDMLPPPEAAA